MDWKKESKKLNNKAVKTPLTENPSTNLLANKTIIALMQNRNKPKVIIVIGIVSITKTGFTKMRNKPKTTATKIAVV